MKRLHGREHTTTQGRDMKEELCCKCDKQVETDIGIRYVRERDKNGKWGSLPICDVCWMLEKMASGDYDVVELGGRMYFLIDFGVVVKK